MGDAFRKIRKMMDAKKKATGGIGGRLVAKAQAAQAAGGASAPGARVQGVGEPAANRVALSKKKGTSYKPTTGLG